jgi:hypothetical protein
MTTYHVGLSIAGTLRQPDRHLDGLITVDGRDLSAKEVRHFLCELKQKKPALELFTGTNCDNQDARGHCQGHPDKDEA